MLDVGVAWSSLGELTPLRRPSYDKDGFGDVLVFGWDMTPPPVAPRPGAWGKFEDFVESALTQMGQAQLDQANSQAAGSQALGSAISAMLGRVADRKNREDGIGFALDVLCVGLSAATIFTPLGLIGLAAFGGSLVLLSADGLAYGAEIVGKDRAAEIIKNKTQVIRLCATIATLPDMAWGGFKTIQEVREIRSLRASSLATAARADADAVRSANRARAYAAIAERARARATARMAKLEWKIAHEMMPRGLVPGGVVLLLDEVTNKDDQGAVGKFLQQYNFHVVAHRR